MFLYFFVKDNELSPWVIFNFSTTTDEPLYIEKLIFNIDGESIEIDTDSETEIVPYSYDSDLLTESYIIVTNRANDNINEAFIKKLANAKSVKIKMEGINGCSITRDLRENQIKAIKDTYDFYVALGGTF